MSLPFSALLSWIWAAITTWHLNLRMRSGAWLLADEKAGDYAEDLAASMLATTLGIEFNPELDWDEREQILKMSGKIVRTTNITQSAVGHKDGLWTTVFAAAVFINDESVPLETGKLVTVSQKGSVQEAILSQALENQPENTEPQERLALPAKEAVKAGVEQRPALARKTPS